jgi:hypothetical protein
MTDLIERLRLGDGTSPDHLLLLEAADAMEKSVECMCGICKLGPLQLKPLKSHEIAQIFDRERMKWNKSPPTYEFDLAFARAIEAAHGIKENT